MLCNRCNKNEARVHLVKMINGKKTEMCLCEKCAKEISNGGLIPFMFEGTEAEEFSKNIESVFNEMKNKENKFSPKIDIICKHCGLTLNEFKKNKKLGCSECYDSFCKELEKIAIDLQGKDIHLGKIPKGEKDKLNKLKRITSLENKLKKAIAMEEYELAAILRDKIKIIKGEFYNNEKLDV